MNLFLSLGGMCDGYQPPNVTPYMHVLVQHVPDFIKEHGIYSSLAVRVSHYASKLDKISISHVKKAKIYPISH